MKPEADRLQSQNRSLVWCCKVYGAASRYGFRKRLGAITSDNLFLYVYQLCDTCAFHASAKHKQGYDLTVPLGTGHCPKLHRSVANSALSTTPREMPPRSRFATTPACTAWWTATREKITYTVTCDVTTCLRSWLTVVSAYTWTSRRQSECVPWMRLTVQRVAPTLQPPLQALMLHVARLRTRALRHLSSRDSRFLEMSLLRSMASLGCHVAD
jgi:hypothetical protein